MRKIVFLLLAIAMTASTFAATLPPTKGPKLYADQILIPVGKTGTKISLLDLSRMSPKELQTLTGQKMNFFDKAQFRIAQKQLRNSIDRDGVFNNKKFEKLLAKKGGETGFHFGGFALGFFLGLIGVLIAYIISDDYQRNRRRWAWFGLGISVAISLIIIAAMM
jgi:hypothetical protein